MIRQPVSIEFDNRGRLWVLQYLQYPNPAGLKAVKQDEYLRTIWDRVPEPPPKGPKGADRLTICYDPDENGRFRKSKDFVTGLNLASGFCIGNGGVYVVQPPYLLFYPDKNEDDVPDGDPEVLLSGFGMEDSHAYANSLQLGPDGWLYGAQGSTVTAKIANPANPKEVIEFQQGIWRYHPKTKRFELFAEGGGNIWGLDFDKHGQMIAGTNFGGVAMMHVVQGGYYVKNWTKHGALHNPHAYGFFEHVPYTGFKGGHVTCGGIIYQGGAYPKEYEDQYIAGNLLSNAIYWHKMEPNGSTFKAHFGGDLLVSNDTWFRPVDLTLGPDGSVYVADWYDKRAAHLDPIDNWDKTNGRVYKIEYQGTKPVPPFDLRTKTSAELVELLKHPNAWWRRQARQLLGERKVSSVRRNLRPLIENETGDVALEALWVWYSLLSWDYSFPAEHNKKWIDPYPNKVSTHPNEYVRAWEIRLRGRLNDDHDYLNEKSPIVLAYTLSAMKRINEYDDNNTGNSIDTLLDKMGVVNSINLNPTAKRDTFLPLMLWWTIEPLTRKDRLSPLRVVQSIKDHGVASNLIVRNATRIVTESEPENLDLLLDFTEKSGDSWMTKSMVEGIDQGINPSSLYGRIVRHKLISVYQKYPDLPAARRVLAKIGYGPALNALLEILINSKATKNDRQQAVDALRSICSPLTLARIKEQLPNVHGDEIVIGFL
ncbi:MAG TPA: PVC-type heme-binding CxxCH protein, partial [Fimbriiglobus sp.]